MGVPPSMKRIESFGAADEAGGSGPLKEAESAPGTSSPAMVNEQFTLW